MRCERIFCVYCKERICTLEKAEIDSGGICRSCESIFSEKRYDNEYDIFSSHSEEEDALSERLAEGLSLWEKMRKDDICFQQQQAAGYREVLRQTEEWRKITQHKQKKTGAQKQTKQG
ncbi:MAG: hypothetical protein ACOX7J_01360 [Bacillota bacterium]|jgi:hypothetical protein